MSIDDNLDLGPSEAFQADLEDGQQAADINMQQKERWVDLL